MDVKSYAQINEKLQKYVKENSDLQQRVESLETAAIRASLQTAQSRSNSDFSKITQLPIGTNFKTLTWIVKEIFPSEKSILLYTDEWNYVVITDGSISAKELAKKYNLRGWGSDLIAQWKDEWVKNIN